MSVDEFLEELAALELDWTWVSYRFDHWGIRSTADGDCLCPIVAVAHSKGHVVGNEVVAGRVLDLSEDDQCAIIKAADNHGGPLRERLPAACSLLERDYS